MGTSVMATGELEGLPPSPPVSWPWSEPPVAGSGRCTEGRRAWVGQRPCLPGGCPRGGALLGFPEMWRRQDVKADPAWLHCAVISGCGHWPELLVAVGYHLSAS